MAAGRLTLQAVLGYWLIGGGGCCFSRGGFRQEHGALPGGLIELGESAEETCRREIGEETGLIAGSLQLINVYSGKNYCVTAENRDQFYAVTIAYYREKFDGEMKMDPQESINIKFPPR